MQGLEGQYPFTRNLSQTILTTPMYCKGIFEVKVCGATGYRSGRVELSRISSPRQ